MAGSIYTGVDIGSDSIKFVTARKGKGGKLQLLNAGIASVGDVSALPDGDARKEGIAAILKGLVADRRAKIRKAHTCVSGNKVITRYAHVPPMPPRRLDKVMAFEIDNEAPAGGEDVASDFKLLDLPNKDAEFTILIGMAKEDVIEGQKTIFDSIGAKVEDVTLGCLPTLHSFMHSKKAELESMPDPCAVVNIGAEKTEIVVLFGQKLYFGRNLSHGSNIFTEAIRQELRIPYENAEKIKRERGQLGEPQAPAGGDIPVIPIAGGPGSSADNTGEEEIPILPLMDNFGAGANPDDEDTALGFAEDEQMISKLTSEPPASAESPGGDPIRRVLESAAHGLVNSIQSCLRYAKVQTRLQNMKIGRIYITGGGAKLPGLARHIQMRLGIETLMFDPLENVDYTRLDPAGREMVEANPYAFVTALGLVAGQTVDQSVDMSLLPRSAKQRREFMKHGVYGWAAAVVFGVTVAAMIAGSVVSTRNLRSHTKRQSANVDKAKEKESDLLRLKAQNADLAGKVDRLEEIILEGGNYLSALAVLKGKSPAGQDGGYQFPPEVVLSSVRTYKSASPPTVTTRKAKKNLYGLAPDLKKLPKVLVVTGGVSDKISPDQSSDIVMRLVEYLDDVKGPLGKDVFAKPKPLRMSTVGQREFVIELTLNEE